MPATSSKKLLNLHLLNTGKNWQSASLNQKGKYIFIQFCRTSQTSIRQLRDSKPNSKDLSSKSSNHEVKVEIKQSGDK